MIKTLSIAGLRSVNERLELAPEANIIHGDNGAGKSSILEAVHFMSFGRSFRTRNPDVMISHQADRFLIHADIEKQELIYSIAIERQRGTTVAKINGDKAPLSMVAQLLPAIFVDTNTYRDFFDKAAMRRRFIDWLVFHVKPEHMQLVRRYNSALKSRNGALKSKCITTPWDMILAEAAAKINSNRAEAIERLRAYVVSNSYAYLDDLSVSYLPGYAVDLGLESCFQDALHKDRVSGKTSVGPHKADVLLSIGPQPAGDVLSQGQLKSLFHQLVRSYKEHLRSAGIVPLVLVDDFQAELDNKNCAALSSIVSGGQSLVTCIQNDKMLEGRLFHVER